jgi:hypothetical protein
MAGPGKPSFGLEKTWRASGTGAQTFNSPSNYAIPYGRYQITVAGRGGTGTAAVPGNPTYNPYTPGNPFSNPFVPGNPNYNPYTPGNPFSNPGTPGNPNYNPYTPASGGNPSGSNPSTPGNYNYYPGYYQSPYYSFYFDDVIPGYYTPGNISGQNPATPGNPNYNPYTPGSGGNFAGNNPFTPGNSGVNPGSGGNFAGNNPGTPGNSGVNPGSGGNFAGNNPTTPAAPGNAATALGVTMPGSNTGGTPAPATPATLVSYYSYPDNATYPVSVPSGGYVTITSS